MDAPNARTKHNVIYSNVLIIILCAFLTDLLCTCCTYVYCPFQSDSNHISSISKPSRQIAHIWSVSEGNNAFIGLKISAKFSYRVDTDNRKNWHLSADTNMVANISCIPSKYFSFAFFKSFMYRWQHCLNDPHSFGSSKTTWNAVLCMSRPVDGDVTL